MAYLKIPDFPISSKSNISKPPRVFSLVVPINGKSQSLPLPVMANILRYEVHFTFHAPTIYVARNEDVNVDLSKKECVSINAIFLPTSRLFEPNDVIHFMNTSSTEEVRVDYEIYFDN